MGSSYNKSVHEIAHILPNDTNGFTKMIAWYQIPAGFKIENMRGAFSMITNSLQNDGSTALNVGNVSSYSVFGMAGQVQGMEELGTSTDDKDDIQSKFLSFLPKTVNLSDTTFDEDYRITLDYAHRGTDGSAFTTTDAVGLGHVKVEEQHPVGDLHLVPFYSRTHINVGAPWGKGFIVGDDRQRYADTWSIDIKTFGMPNNKSAEALYAFPPNGPLTIAWFISIPSDLGQADFGHTYFVDNSSDGTDAEHDYDTWVASFDAYSAFTPNSASSHSETGGDVASGVQMMPQKANPIFRSGDAAIGATQKPNKMDTRMIFDNIVVSPIAPVKDQSKRNLALNRF